MIEICKFEGSDIVITSVKPIDGNFLHEIKIASHDNNDMNLICRDREIGFIPIDDSVYILEKKVFKESVKELCIDKGYEGSEYVSIDNFNGSIFIDLCYYDSSDEYVSCLDVYDSDKFLLEQSNTDIQEIYGAIKIDIDSQDRIKEAH